MNNNYNKTIIQRIISFLIILVTAWLFLAYFAWAFSYSIIERTGNIFQSKKGSSSIFKVWKEEGNCVIRLSWIKKKDPSVEKIIIQYNDKGTPRVIELEKDITAVCISNLENGHEYRFTLKTINSEHIESEEFIIPGTPDLKMQQEVSDVTAETGAHGIKISWNEPVDKNIKFIRISYRPHGLKPVTIKTGIRSFTAYNLTLSELYNFRIQTITNDGTISVGKSIIQKYDKTISFSDKHLETVIREKLGNYSDTILFSHLKHITELKLANRQIQNIANIKYCKNLTKLEISGNIREGCDEIADLWNLSYLSFQNNTDGTILNILPNINVPLKLAVTACGLSADDLNRLPVLRTLIALDIKNTELNNINFIVKFPELKELTLFSNNITDKNFYSLSKLNNLEKLAIINNNIADLNFLKIMTGLQKLTLFNCFIEKDDTAPLVYLKELKELEISYTKIGSIKFLNKMKALKTLRMIGLSVNDSSLEFITGLSRLNYLDLSFNNLKEPAFLSSLSDLVTLKISFNSIKNLDFIDTMTAIEKLDISNTFTSTIQNLLNLKKIKNLNCANNRIHDLSVLEYMQKKGIIESGSTINLTNNGLHIEKDSENYRIINTLQQSGIQIEFKTGNIIDE